MTPPTKAELREAMWKLIEYHLTALQGAVREPGFDSMPEPYFGALGAIDFIQTILDPAIRRWTAFLDSALAENEREVVRKVRQEIADAFPFGRDSIRSGLDAKVDAWVAALAPIAEGGDKP